MTGMFKKLSISLIAVVFAIVALGTTTFAWFSLTNKAGTSNVIVQVSSSEGLDVRIDQNGPWYSGEISYDFTGRLEDITYTKDGFKRLDVESVSYLDPEIGDYVDVDVFFRTTTRGSIKISMAEVTSETINFTSDMTFNPQRGSSVTFGEVIKVNAAYASRMMIGSVMFETPSISGDDIVFPHNTKGLQKADDDFGSVQYFNVRTNQTLSGLEVPNYPLTYNYGSYSDSSLITVIDEVYEGSALDGYFYGYTTIRIWIEGWDAECYNAIYGANISANLEFEFVKR